MTKEVLACPDIDGRDTRKVKNKKTPRQYQIESKHLIGKNDNPAAENGKEKIYEINILQVSTGESKKVTGVTWVEDCDECLEPLFNNGN
jgi:formylmethanofuran dehydrogenase subunit E